MRFIETEGQLHWLQLRLYVIGLKAGGVCLCTVGYYYLNDEEAREKWKDTSTACTKHSEIHL